MEEAALQAKMMQQENPQPAQPAAGGVPGVADTSGAGGANIGIGQAPVPGEQGFSGNAGTPAPQAGGQPPQAPVQ